MSRPITTRFRIFGTLVAETPLHVGGIDGNPATDLPLSVDGHGRPCVPGTSLAGPLRHWLMERFDGEDGGYAKRSDGEHASHTERFWGRIPVKGNPLKGDQRDKGRASYVHVDDAEVMLPSGAQAEIRDGVGIDREFGTAVDRIKFDREVLPKGTKIPLRMTVDSTKDVDGRGEIRALLEALMQGDIRIGAAKTRGLGRVLLIDVHVERFDIGTPDGVLAFLRARGATQPSGRKQGLDILGPEKSGHEHPRIRIDIDWAPKGPVMVKAGADGTVVDMMPLVTANGAGGATPVIPGASSKGALRQHSERILATVLQEPVVDDKPGLQRFIKQLMRLHLVETLYGAVKKRAKGRNGEERKKSGDVEDLKPTPGLGALRIDDCLAVLSLPRTDLDTIADGELPAGRHPAAGNGGDKDERRERTRADALKAAVKAATHHGIDIARHVAIDRWTGGAADGALFTAAEPRLKWNPLRIEIDTRRLVPASGEVVDDKDDKDLVPKAAVALLLLTLKDMADGLVPLGFGVNRGYGDIDVLGVEIKVAKAPADHWAKGLDGVRIAKRDDSRADFTLMDKIKPLAVAWGKYIELREEHAHAAKAAAETEAHK